MSIKSLLSDLCSAPGPSGAEGGVMAAARGLAQNLGGAVSFDNLGNLTALFKSPRQNAPLIMLDAHLDEISLIITGDAGGGFFRFRAIGHDPRVLPGAAVSIITPEGSLPGLITSVPPHVLSPKQAQKAYRTEDLLIDTGSLGGPCGVSVGSRAVLKGRFAELSGGMISAGALDNRAGFACLLEALRLLLERGAPPCDIALVGSVMEEVGGMGALTSANRLCPDAALIVDVTHAKTPDSSGDNTFKAGSGPAIGIGPNLDRGLAKTLENIARRQAISHSLEVMAGNTGTNAWPVQISGRGIACALISIPLKYMHTPQEVISILDIENSARLISSFICQWAGGFS